MRNHNDVNDYKFRLVLFPPPKKKYMYILPFISFTFSLFISLIYSVEYTCKLQLKNYLMYFIKSNYLKDAICGYSTIVNKTLPFTAL